MKAWPVGFLLLISCAHSAASLPEPLRSWRVTSGKLDQGPDGTLEIRNSSVRAELAHAANAVTLEFEYSGPTARAEPLASGELRRQIGLKLRAQDTCNVVYVMWHVEPRPGIEVAVKHNPGLHDHPACGDRGYAFVKPDRALVPAPIQPDTWHSLSARLQGRTLEVSADGTIAWQGSLPATALEFDGPVGLRSDNGRFRFRYMTAPMR